MQMQPALIVYVLLAAFAGYCAVDSWGVLHGFGVVAALVLLSPKLP